MAGRPLPGAACGARRDEGSTGAGREPGTGGVTVQSQHPRDRRASPHPRVPGLRGLPRVRESVCVWVRVCVPRLEGRIWAFRDPFVRAREPPQRLAVPLRASVPPLHPCLCPARDPPSGRGRTDQHRPARGQ